MILPSLEFYAQKGEGFKRKKIYHKGCSGSSYFKNCNWKCSSGENWLSLKRWHTLVYGVWDEASSLCGCLYFNKYGKKLRNNIPFIWLMFSLRRFASSENESFNPKNMKGNSRNILYPFHPFPEPCFHGKYLPWVSLQGCWMAET